MPDCSGVPRGLVRGPLLLLSCVNNLSVTITQCKIFNFVFCPSFKVNINGSLDASYVDHDSRPTNPRVIPNGFLNGLSSKPSWRANEEGIHECSGLNQFNSLRIFHFVGNPLEQFAQKIDAATSLSVVCKLVCTYLSLLVLLFESLQFSQRLFARIRPSWIPTTGHELDLEIQE